MDSKLRRRSLMMLAVVYMLVSGGPAFPEPTYSIVNAPSEVASGEVFTVDIVLDLDGNSSIGHEVSVNFSPGFLIADSAIELGVPPYQLNLGPGVRDIDNLGGIVDQFEAASFAPVSTTTPFIVGQITFEAGDIGEAMIFGFFDTGAAVLDGAGLAIDGVTFNTVSVNVVAMPTATPTAAPICQKPSTACRKDWDCCSGLCVGKGSNKTCQSNSTPTPTNWPAPTPTATPTATPDGAPICQQALAACRRNSDCCSNLCAGKGPDKICQP